MLLPKLPVSLPRAKGQQPRRREKQPRAKGLKRKKRGKLLKPQGYPLNHPVLRLNKTENRRTEPRISETVRASAEIERETAEGERETAETARTSAETSRVTAEQGRVSAENTRVSQEQERQAEILKIAGMTVEVTTLAAGTQATAELVESGDHKVLKLGIPKGQDGSGTGDMSKSVYDTNGNGAVDNAEKLEGHDASYFSPATHNHDGVYQPAGTYATRTMFRGRVGA